MMIIIIIIKKDLFFFFILGPFFNIFPFGWLVTQGKKQSVWLKEWSPEGRSAKKKKCINTLFFLIILFFSLYSLYYSCIHIHNMFQFFNDWKRKGNKDEQDNRDSPMVRTCSMNSTSSASPSDCSMNWNHKRALSFKEDYVSFPSLEPSASEVTCSN